MPRKKNTEKKASKRKIEFSDGKNSKAENESIETILGFKEKNHFGTTNVKEFEDKLETLSMSELQAMAVTASVFPSGTKVSLKNKLKKAFNQYLSLNGRTAVPRESNSIDLDSDAAKKFLEIMNG